MAKLLKLKNKLYRREIVEIWGNIIQKGRYTKLFKLLMNKFSEALKNSYFRRYYSLKSRQMLLHYLRKRRKKFFKFRGFLLKKKWKYWRQLRRINELFHSRYKLFQKKKKKI